jgi:hypothetical protein
MRPVRLERSIGGSEGSEAAMAVWLADDDGDAPACDGSAVLHAARTRQTVSVIGHHTRLMSFLLTSGAAEEFRRPLTTNPVARPSASSQFEVDRKLEVRSQTTST